MDLKGIFILVESNIADVLCDRKVLGSCKSKIFSKLFKIKDFKPIPLQQMTYFFFLT